MRVRPFAAAGLLLVLSAVVGMAGGHPAPAGQAREASAAPPTPPLAQAGLQDKPDDVQQTLFTPGSTYRVSIVADGGPLRIGVRLTSGASLGGTLYGPAGCPTDAFMTTVIGLATSGQELASTECQVPAGRLTVAIDTGESAFLGSIELNGGTFA